MPVDVVKTRLQMDGSGGSVKLYNGSMDCAAKLAKSEGPGALFKGLPPALVRQSTYGSLRYGLYGPIKNSMGIKAGEKVPLWKKILAGGSAGGIASAVANPTDLIKVRLQTDGMTKDAEGKYLPKRFNGMVHAFTTVVKEEGVLALWTGVGCAATTYWRNRNGTELTWAVVRLVPWSTALRWVAPPLWQLQSSPRTMR